MPLFRGSTGGSGGVGVQASGVAVGTRAAINLIPGAGVGIVVADDAANSRVNITISAVSQAPTITGFSPGGAPVAGVVTITGTNFTGTTSVTFNGVAASYTVNSSTQITATVPAGATSGPIVVSTPSGSATSANFLVSTGFAAAVLATSPGPAAYYRMDETSGTTAVAAAGSNASYIGATVNTASGWEVASTAGKSVAFAGGSAGASQLYWGTQAGYNGGSVLPFTLQFWIYPTAAFNAGGTYLFGSNIGGSFGHEIYAVGGGGLGYSRYTGTTANMSTSGAHLPAQTTWTLYHITCDGTTIRIYKNGADTSSSSLTPVTIPAGTADTSWASSGSQIFGRASFVGRLDETAHWNRALTAGEISNLYAAR